MYLCVICCAVCVYCCSGARPAAICCLLVRLDVHKNCCPWWVFPAPHKLLAAKLSTQAPELDSSHHACVFSPSAVHVCRDKCKSRETACTAAQNAHIFKKCLPRHFCSDSHPTNSKLCPTPMPSTPAYAHQKASSESLTKRSRNQKYTITKMHISVLSPHDFQDFLRAVWCARWDNHFDTSAAKLVDQGRGKWRSKITSKSRALLALTAK